ncbi:peptidoglycan DD-metalloendopeptidase family protein [Hydrotalea sp.]|uniref:peptidoglycan DD-metalloendopeptidase family protein n=1 Tax=Hydrotalea sp. TaxID=2881279 RepID=UPI002633C91C|nr:peptidoglycan DD-metalloendopeptidase family protein [Hydrotalea sp.]
MDRITNFYERMATLQGNMAAVIPFNSHTDKLVAMDFTEKNDRWQEAVVNNVQLFSENVQQVLQKANARYGIGGYLEYRSIYARSRVFDGTEPRRIHLGIDVWGEAGTPVMAPIAGTVHSYAFNHAYGDYGATIILQHQIEELPFYILYGHLALKSLQNITEGQYIEQGKNFAWLGVAEENGYWPPHLHFQLMLNMEGYKGDYPGVCAAHQLTHYAQNCPNPDVILQMQRYAMVDF